MRTLHPNSGKTLLITIGLLVVLGVFTGVALNFTTQQGRFARNSSDVNKAMFVADSQLERLFDQWRDLMESKPLGTMPTDAEIAALGGAPDSLRVVHPKFSDLTGLFLPDYLGKKSNLIEEVDALGGKVPQGKSSRATGAFPGFRGLYASRVTYDARVAVKAETLGHALPPLEVARTFTRIEVPVFQTAIFYEDDLELHPGASMTINGPVISNHRIYARALDPHKLEFGSVVIANKEPNAVVPGVTYKNRDPGDKGYNESLPPGSTYNERDYSDPAFSDSAKNQILLANRLEPSGKAMRRAFDAKDSNPNNDGYRELIEKPVSGYPDPPSVANFRLYNQAGLKISVADNAGTLTVTASHLDGSPVAPGVLSEIRGAIGTRKGVYDKREAQSVKVTPIDVDRLRPAISMMNSSPDPARRFNGILYFSDDTPGASRWAVRLENAARLPTFEKPADSPPSERGFTVATAGGVYLKGDYNTRGGAETVPAAIMADAVMFLSNAWSDTNAANPILGVDDGAGGTAAGTGRQATETTYRAAIMAGTIPSGYDPDNNSATANSYGSGGGAHNFPRMLEQWTNVDMNFTGSMVQLFTSKMFTGRWQTGDVYHPPIRNWSHNADSARRPSPGLFAFTTYIRGPWRRN